MNRLRADRRFGLQRAAGLALALVGGLMVGLALVMGGAFRFILDEAEQARSRLAPSITEQLQQAVSAAQLSRQAEVVINSQNRDTRMQAMREADALAAGFVASASVELQSRLDSAMHAIRRSAYRADLTDALRAALARAESLSQNALLRAAEEAGARDIGVERLKLSLRLHRLLTEAVGADAARVDALEVEFRSLAGAAALAAFGLPAAGNEMMGVFETRREILRVAQESAHDADRAHEQLRALTAGLQADAEAQARAMAGVVHLHGSRGLWAAGIGFAAALAALGGIAALLRRHVVSPIRAAAAALDTVRRDRRRVALPSAALREVDDLSRAVESFGDVLGELQGLAHIDPLTGLGNRRLLLEHLRHAVAQARRNGRPGAVMFLDLDGFKQVNDALGHRRGDELLTEIAGRLTACVRGGDLVARVGGDEFCIVSEDMSSLDDAPGLAARVIDALSRPALNGRAEIGVSVGIAYFPADESDGESVTGETLVHRADEAMYAAKRAGKGCCRIWESKEAEASA